MTKKLVSYDDAVAAGTRLPATVRADLATGTQATAQTLTNKTIPLGSNTVSGTLAQFNSACTDANFAQAVRVVTTASSATPVVNADTTDVYGITALAANITGWVMGGTPSDGQKLWIYIVPTATRTIVWTAGSFDASAVALPTTITTRVDIGFIWNSPVSQWRCVGVV